MRHRIAALLGPTNTGKTHRAIERMLAWPSGMIGLPLRLLAREVYDRIVERRGPGGVALITGEEKRIPSDPSYWVCTVEAMPLQRRVAFLAVDEIQLAGDRNRGHTFTDRILNARGVHETLFLGASTIQPLLERLVPGIEIEGAPRLSKLSWAGARKLASLPPRTAVIAFSAERVYETAERLRALHGGTAVVLGALSPRTRNAQVQMYEAGEVQHLVATDAIGMGLNMDVQHVAFTDVRKFDGRGFRDLTPAEVGQIAGRAGRYRTDGTFGTTRDLGALEPHLVEAVEEHRFEPLRALFWRNSALDFSSPERLLESLQQSPPARGLVPALAEEDQLALESLLQRPEVRQRAAGARELERLWEICRVPDYRKTHTGAHAELLGHLAQHLLDDGVLPEDFVAERVERLDRTDGDIETLMSRIAWVRTWTYVAWQRTWTAEPDQWQQRTSAVEDRLSDALHERLTARFVDRRVAWVLAGSTVQAEVAVVDGEVRIGGIGVGTVSSWSFSPGPGLPRGVGAAVTRHLRTAVLERLAALCEAPDSAVVLDPAGRLVFGTEALAELEAGPDVREPKLSLFRLDLLEPDERERARQRLTRWLKAWVAELFAPLGRSAAAGLDAPARGLVHALRQGLGTVDVSAVADNLAAMGAEDRRVLARLDVRLGARTIYVQSLLKQEPMRRRAALWSVFHQQRPLLQPPTDGRPAFPYAGQDKDFLRAVGYRGAGGLAIRVDLLERVLAEAARMSRRREPMGLETLMSWLGCSAERVIATLEDLDLRVRTHPDGRVQLRRRS